MNIVSLTHSRRFFVTTLVITLVFSLYLIGSTIKTGLGFESVEVGVAELSPNGLKGGYAIPASGGSVTCTLDMSTTELTSGGVEDVTLTITGGYSGGMTIYLDGVKIGSAVDTFTDQNSSELLPGTYTYTASGGYTVDPIETCVDQDGVEVCTVECKEQDPDTNYCIEYWHSSTYSWSCSSSLTVIGQCSDGTDNDNDGYTDYDALGVSGNGDLGCSSADDPSESGPPQCSDIREDNDGDGNIDYPADPGCQNATDDDETTPAAIISISASPVLVRSGGDSNITWDAELVTSCTVTGPGLSQSSGEILLPYEETYTGSYTATNITEEHTYTLSCIALDESIVEDIAVVNILPTLEEF